MPRPLIAAAIHAPLLASLACSAAADPAPASRVAGPAPAPLGAAADAAPGPTRAAPAATAPSESLAEPTGLSANPAPPCSASRAGAEIVHEPVDIIVVMDNSGSMLDEARSVEANINLNFAQILANSGVDYRVILVSQHRSSDGLGQRTAVCVSAPLSGLAQCPADRPVSGERFFHYSVEVGSHDSLELLLETYDGSQPDDFGLAPKGWSEWLRVEAKKVFLEITDDDARGSASTFLSDLRALAPGQFGTIAAQTNLVWHSIIGVAQKDVPTEPYLPSEPLQNSRCTGNTVFAVGETYQELSRLTGGLRFPICEFAGYDRVFQTIANDVTVRSQIACGFAIPAPPTGQRVELDKVAVAYAPGDGSGPQLLGQVTERSQCGDDAFLIEAGAISLCPEACAKIRRDSAAAIDVVFSCASTVVLR